LSSKEILENIKEAKSGIRNTWLNSNNIFRVEYGFKYVDGVRTEDLGIRFFVKEKKTKSELLRKELIPSSINGFSTDIIKYGERTNNPFGNYFGTQSLKGGIGIYNDDKGDAEFGTLGAFIKLKEKYYGVSCFHVLFNYHDEDIERYFGNKVMSVDDFQIGKISSTLHSKNHDYALIELKEGLNFRLNKINSIQGEITGYISPKKMEKMKLLKYGARTGLTKGVVDGWCLYDENICNRNNLVYDSFSIVPESSSIINKISDNGDSGYAWVHKMDSGELKLVGLHYDGKYDIDNQINIAFAISFKGIYSSLINKI